MASLEQAAKELNIKAAVSTLIISAFGFVAALFWRDAIKEFINEFVPEGEGLLYSFGVAIAVTVLAVVVIFVLSRWMSTSIVRERVKKNQVKGRQP